MSDLTFLEQLQNMLSASKIQLKDFATAIEQPDSCNELTEKEIIFLIESLRFVANDWRLTCQDELIIWQCQIKLVTHAKLYDYYRDSFKNWCCNVLYQMKRDDISQKQYYTYLAIFYMNIQEYDKCLKYYNKVEDKQIISDLDLSLIYAKSSEPDIVKIVDLLSSSQDIDLDCFVKQMEITHCRLMISILIELYKLDQVTVLNKIYIDDILLKYCLIPTNMEPIIHSGYFSRKVFVEMGLYLCNPINKCSELDARYVLNKLHSFDHVAESRTIDVCESLLVGNIDGMVAFVDTDDFLNLTAKQRADIYLGIYIHLGKIDVGQAILFSIQALMIHDGMDGSVKTRYMIDVIKYFASIEGWSTYRYYLCEYIHLSKQYPNIEEMIEILGLCLSTKHYRLADNLYQLILTHMKYEDNIHLIKALQRSDRQKDLKDAMERISTMTPSLEIYEITSVITQKLVDLSSPSRKRSSPSCSRPEQIAEKQPRVSSSNFCKVCQEEFDDINVHEKTAKHLEKIGLFCFDCDRLFKSKTSLESHLFSCKGDQDLTHYCYPCQKNFSSLQAFNKHRNIMCH